MRGLLAVGRREVTERWPVAAAGLVLGLVPLVLPLLPRLGRLGAAELREASALALFWGATVLFGSVLGGSVVGRDLVERRLGFYFSRPISVLAIWAGKLGAAFVLAVVSSALVLAPTVVVGGRLPGQGVEPAGFSLVALLGSPLLIWSWPLVTVLVVQAAHAVRVALAARTGWLALDLAMVLALPAVGATCVGRLVAAWAFGAALAVAAGLAVALLLSLGAASAVALQRGRVSLARSHRLQSLTLWSLLAAACLASLAASEWILASGPRQIREIRWVEASPAGPWIWVSGRARADYSPSFLLNVETGSWLRAGSDGVMPPGWRRVALAGDGSAAVWVENSPPWPPSRLDWPRGAFFRADLGTESPVAEPLPPVGARAWLLALSPGGGLVSSASAGGIDLWRVDRPARPRRFELPRRSWIGHLEFAADSILVAGASCGAELGEECAQLVWRLDPTTGEIAELVRVSYPDSAVVDSSWTAFEVDGERALAVPQRAAEGGESPAFRLDIGSGRATPLALPPSPDAPWAASLLADGRVLLARSAAEGQLAVLDRDGRVERSVSIDRPVRVVVGGEAAPGRVLVGTAPLGTPDAPPPGGAEDSTAPWTAWWVDLATGERRRVADGALPAGRPGLGPESAGSRLLQRGPGDLFLVDPDTLELRQVL